MSGLTEKISGLYKGVKDIGRSSLLIGSLLPIVLGFGACGKKDNPFIPPIDPLQPVITGSVYNLTTGVNNAYEINDTMRVVATGQDPEGIGFSNFYVGIFKNGVEVGSLTGAVAGNDLTLENTLKLDDPNLVGDLQFKVVFDRPDYDIDTQLIGQGRCEAERDYIWGADKNSTIYNNRETIADIMIRNMKANNGKNYTRDELVKIIENFYHPQTGFAVGTDLFDTAPGNSFQFRGPTSAALFVDGTEKDLYDLRNIINQ